MAGFTFIDSDDGLSEYSIDGGANWYEVPAMVSYVESGGESSPRTIRVLRSSKQISGKPGIPTVAIECVLNPVLQAWSDFRDQVAKSAALLWRFTSKEPEVLYAKTATIALQSAAIAADGVVTFAGSQSAPPFVTSEDFAPGTIIVMAVGNYVVDSIDSAGVVKVRPVPAAVVAAGIFKVETPKIQRPSYAGKITNPPDLFNVAIDTEVTTTLNIAPSSTLPKATIQNTF